VPSTGASSWGDLQRGRSGYELALLRRAGRGLGQSSGQLHLKDRKTRTAGAERGKRRIPFGLRHGSPMPPIAVRRSRAFHARLIERSRGVSR